MVFVGVVVVTSAAETEDVDSTKWAGYASAVDEGSFERISARWVVPRIECTPGEVHTEVAVWIGLDGVNNEMVEQVGTTSECEGDPDGKPKYFAWAEAYPEPAHQLKIEVRPGDTIAASIRLEEGKFNFSVRNETLGTEDSDSWDSEGPGLSAEAVVEAPPGRRLPQFDPIRFYDVQVDEDPIKEIDPDRFVLVTAEEPRVVRAEPGELSDGGTEFSVVYRSH